MAKPSGAACNLNCRYCFYLKKGELYPEDVSARMSEEVMESYIRQTFESQPGPIINITWQGGEPTLMGIDFFRKAVDCEKKYRRPGMEIERTLQTNGILLDDTWCDFLHENRFLVGISLDGPQKMHDAYRRDKEGKPTFERVMQAVGRMQKHGVEFNILTTVNSANADHPLEVYRFLRDEVKTGYIQFIPIVEQDPQAKAGVTEHSVGSRQYGMFLSAIFDEWASRDVGKVFVLNFDFSLANWLGYSSTCIFSPECGNALALERNGDLYSCDHFVGPDHLLGNILNAPMSDLVNLPKQRAFGSAKKNTLPRYCQKCEVLFVCNGECPKNRFIKTSTGEEGLNYLCEGYKYFFNHIDPQMKAMAQLLRSGRRAEEIMTK